jgi:hypothetical protein
MGTEKELWGQIRGYGCRDRIWEHEREQKEYIGHGNIDGMGTEKGIWGKIGI